MSRLFNILSVVVLLCSSSFGQGLTYEEQVHDFGHVGIDFRLLHTFQYTNKTSSPVRISTVEVSCDCSEVNFSDSLVEPGATVDFDLIFSTKDYYGPTNKNVKIITDDPTMPEFTYFYMSIVGQWYDALKPSPISLFILPGMSSKSIKIQNLFFDKLNFGKISQYDDKFSYKIIEDDAAKGNFIEIELRPSEGIGVGTHFTVLTFEIMTDKEKPVIISVPVKIVRY